MTPQALQQLVEKLRSRAQEFRTPLAQAAGCQCDPAWHADEIEGWADELDTVIAASREKEQEDLARVDVQTVIPPARATAPTD